MTVKANTLSHPIVPRHGAPRRGWILRSRGVRPSANLSQLIMSFICRVVGGLLGNAFCTETQFKIREVNANEILWPHYTNDTRRDAFGMQCAGHAGRPCERRPGRRI